MLTWLVGAAVVVVVGVAWAWFEAGWLRRRVIEVELEGVPAELDGLRIAHLSDLHLGVPSRGRRAVRDAVDWVVERRPTSSASRAISSRAARGCATSSGCSASSGRATSCSATTTSPTAAIRSRSASIRRRSTRSRV